MNAEKRELQNRLLGVQGYLDLAVKLFEADADPRKVKECLAQIRENTKEGLFQIGNIIERGR